MSNVPEPAVTPHWASNVRVVLVEPQHPGNVGSAARAMKNMGLRDLALVSPRRFPHADAEAMAAGAKDVLATAQVHATLTAAVQDCSLIVGTTARDRYLSQPVYTPREWVTTLAGQPPAGRIALLFGRERTGLTNDELDVCQALITVPVNPDYPSLNLAQAVQVLSYELRLAQLAGGEAIPATAPDPAQQPVPQVEMERFYEHLERVLVKTRFLNPDNPRFLMRRLRLLYSRLDPNPNEMNILRGILTAVEDSLRRLAG